VLAFAINGMVRGGAYALVALGLVLVFRTSRVVNFAYGAIATFSIFTFVSLAGWLPRPLAFLAALVVAGVIGLAMERTTMRPLQERSGTAKLVATLGWLLAIQFAIDIVFGTQLRFAPALFPSGSVPVFGVRLAWFQVGLVVIMLLLALALSQWLERTRFGTKLRAVAQDRSAAHLLGVDANRVTAVAWAAGGLLAGLAGILYAPAINLDSRDVTVLMFHGFAVALVADFTSFRTAVLAGVAIGGVEDLAKYFVNQAGIEDLAMFAVVLTVLLVRSSSRGADLLAMLPRPRGREAAA
jgi:branched-subunit amino acid ABC-type transport system permease component